MEYVTLGRTGLRVSVLGLGGGGHSRLGQRTGATEGESTRLVRRALELGITFVDTAFRPHVVRCERRGLAPSPTSPESSMTASEGGAMPNEPTTPLRYYAQHGCMTEPGVSLGGNQAFDALRALYESEARLQVPALVTSYTMDDKKTTVVFGCTAQVLGLIA